MYSGATTIECYYQQDDASNARYNPLPVLFPIDYLGVDSKPVFLKADIEGSESDLLFQIRENFDLMDKVFVFALESSALDQVISYAYLLSDGYRMFYIQPMWRTGSNAFLKINNILNSLKKRRFRVVEFSSPLSAEALLPISLIFFIHRSCIEDSPIASGPCNALCLVNRDLFGL